MLRIVVPLVVALLVGAVGFVLTFWLGIAATVSSECDGVCFDKFDEIGIAAIVVGLLCAAASGWIAYRIMASRGQTA